jgi:hypothetical protein
VRLDYLGAGAQAPRASAVVGDGVPGRLVGEGFSDPEGEFG